MIHEDQPLKGLLSFDFRCIQNPLENTFLDPGLSSQVQRSPLRLCWVLSQQAISLKCAVKFKFVKFSSFFFLRGIHFTRRNEIKRKVVWAFALHKWTYLIPRLLPFFGFRIERPVSRCFRRSAKFTEPDLVEVKSWRPTACVCLAA